MSKNELFVSVLTAASTLDLVPRDLESMQRATKSRKTRASLGDQVAARGGVIKASQCRELYFIRKKKEEEKLNRKEEREVKKANRAPSAPSPICRIWHF